MSEPIEVCVKCEAKKINGVWIYRGKEPPHEPSYKHSICPQCTKKVKT